MRWSLCQLVLCCRCFAAHFWGGSVIVVIWKEHQRSEWKHKGHSDVSLIKLIYTSRRWGLGSDWSHRLDAFRLDLTKSERTRSSSWTPMTSDFTATSPASWITVYIRVTWPIWRQMDVTASVPRQRVLHHIIKGDDEHQQSSCNVMFVVHKWLVDAFICGAIAQLSPRNIHFAQTMQDFKMLIVFGDPDDIIPVTRDPLPLNPMTVCLTSVCGSMQHQPAVSQSSVLQAAV